MTESITIGMSAKGRRILDLKRTRAAVAQVVTLDCFQFGPIPVMAPVVEMHLTRLTRAINLTARDR